MHDASARRLVVLLARSASLASVPPSSRRIRCHSNIPSHSSRAGAKKERWQQQALKHLDTCTDSTNSHPGGRCTTGLQPTGAPGLLVAALSGQLAQATTTNPCRTSSTKPCRPCSPRARVHPTTAAHTLSDYSSRRMRQQTVRSTPLHHCISTQTLTHQTLLHRTSTSNLNLLC